ncbi:MAG: M14 family metallopeptidase [Acidobacteriota bacterium]|nr:M14 family metallopeptidase [Acidobacteriota bacterium]
MLRWCAPFVLALLFVPASSGAQDTGPLPVLSPGTKYDPKIPTIEQVLGYGHGERITTPENVEKYLRALTAAAPDRTRLGEYARSWQDRPLWLLVIGNRERMARIDDIRTSRRQLTRATGAEADRLVQTQPVVTALLHSVHGNENSGVDAALAEAYHLLAAVGDPTVDLIMRESLVLIDPMQNPDGRARFVASNTQAQAVQADEDPAAAEHDEGWPGGRTNHYLFDLNRDWFAQNHPESQGKVRFLLEWLPQVTVDLHEMGGESQYYFPPAASPNTPNTTQAQRDWMVTFGKANAARFDDRGFHYFIRETYDSFYPGYGASWPFFIGSLGKTFEMAGTRGLAYRRSDGTLLTYRDGVVRHFTAAIQTAATAAANRDRMLRDFIAYHRTAVAEGGTTEYVLLAGNDASRASRLAQVLIRNGLEVHRTAEPGKAGTRDIPAGSFIVPLAQPMGRLVRTLLDPHVSMGDEFIAEQDRRRKLRLPDQIYDITSWSLPLLYDIELVVSERPTGALDRRVDPSVPLRVPAAKVGYLIPWGTGTAAAMADLRGAGFTLRATGAGFTLGGRQFGIGTVILRNEENPPHLAAALQKIGSRHVLDIVPIDTAWVDAGTSLGANSVRIVKTPRVLMLWDIPTQSLSAGWARFSLERRFNQPVTIVRGGSFARARLADYDVVILPAGNYGSVLSGATLDRVREWMRTGGTLITLGEASRWAAGAGLLDTSTELRDGSPDRPAAAGAPAAGGGGGAPQRPNAPYDYDAAITPARERPEATSGVIARVLMNMEHWMSSGTDGEIAAMIEGDRVFEPLTLDRGTNVGVYAEEATLVAGGLVWPEVRRQLARKAFLMHQATGQGHIIAFAEDPNFRGFTELTQMLMMNAVLFGPAR